jgi:hypothetical protein
MSDARARQIAIDGKDLVLRIEPRGADGQAVWVEQPSGELASPVYVVTGSAGAIGGESPVEGLADFVEGELRRWALMATMVGSFGDEA